MKCTATQLPSAMSVSPAMKTSRRKMPAQSSSHSQLRLQWLVLVEPKRRHDKVSAVFLRNHFDALLWVSALVPFAVERHVSEESFVAAPVETMDCCDGIFGKVMPVTIPAGGWLEVRRVVQLDFVADLEGVFLEETIPVFA